MWQTGTILALAAVVGLASPAAAAVDSTTTVTASPAAATVGATVTLTATVTCAADPSARIGVTFFDGGEILDTVAVGADGRAEETTVFTTTGTHTITAAYSGNSNCFASSNMTSVVVTAAPVPPNPPADWCSYGCCDPVGFAIGNFEYHT